MSYIVSFYVSYECKTTNHTNDFDIEAEPKLTVWFGMGEDGPQVEDVEITDADGSPISPTEAMKLALDKAYADFGTFADAAREQGWRGRRDG